MLKHLIVLASVAAATAPACALGTGDLAFTSFNADEDGFSVVTFVDIEQGERQIAGAQGAGRCGGRGNSRQHEQVLEQG